MRAQTEIHAGFRGCKLQGVGYRVLAPVHVTLKVHVPIIIVDIFALKCLHMNTSRPKYILYGY